MSFVVFQHQSECVLPALFGVSVANRQQNRRFKPRIRKEQKDLVFSVVFRHYTPCLLIGLWLNWFLALCFCYGFSMLTRIRHEMNACAKYHKAISDVPQISVNLRALSGSCQLQYLNRATRF